MPSLATPLTPIELLLKAACELPSQRDRLVMLEDAQHWFHEAGHEAIGMDHYALATDSLAIAPRSGRLHRNFQGHTTGGDHDLLGVGPTVISQFPQLMTQNEGDLKAYTAALEEGRLPVERGVVVREREVLERREMIRQVMCEFTPTLELARFCPHARHSRSASSDDVRLPLGNQAMTQAP
jgi:oxygen-independent coproporphyrinogen-3 oxidase